MLVQVIMAAIFKRASNFFQATLFPKVYSFEIEYTRIIAYTMLLKRGVFVGQNGEHFQ